jgi:CubicO group peptidase (beta-lactamase class C family)
MRILPEKVFELDESLKTPDSKKPILGWYFEANNIYHATGWTGCHCVVYPELNAIGVRMLNRWYSPALLETSPSFFDDEVDTFNNTLLNCLKVSTLSAI